MGSILRALPGLDTAPLEEGAVVFEPTSGKFLLLNPSAAYVWAELESATTANDLAVRLCERFPDLPEAIASSDVQDLVDQMLSLGIVESLVQE